MQKIPLRNRKNEIIAYAFCDDEDYELLSQFKWHRTAQGYARHSFTADRKIKMHRMILDLGKSFQGSQVQIDHANRNKLDNRRENPRLVNASENCRNKSKRPDNTSGFTGVSWDKEAKKWSAQISIVRGKYKKLGRFSTKEDAALAYAEAKAKYWTLPSCSSSCTNQVNGDPSSAKT
jgi:AP2 domain